MATQTDGTPTPPEVEKHATEEAKLERLALLGTFGASHAPRALVRLRRGATQTVNIGDSVDGRTVQAIGHGELVLMHNGTVKILRMPQV
ncbi:hypothetical protein [Sulfitobacter guttiformis]|nr:hypothetical protein [Sulfitobacter guttiformis]